MERSPQLDLETEVIGVEELAALAQTSKQAVVGWIERRLRALGETDRRYFARKLNTGRSAWYVLSRRHPLVEQYITGTARSRRKHRTTQNSTQEPSQ